MHASVVSQASSLSLMSLRQMNCKIVRNFYAASFKVETLLDICEYLVNCSVVSCDTCSWLFHNRSGSVKSC